jgi:hypothetical protein
MWQGKDRKCKQLVCGCKKIGSAMAKIISLWLKLFLSPTGPK